MSIPIAPNDPRIRIFVKNTWIDIYRKVRQADGGLITISMGNEDEALGDEINPSECEFTLDNNDGAFMPDNPMSPYYPDLEVNTPVCVLTDEVYDVFSRVVAAGWSDSTTGETYSTGSITGPFNATDFSVDGNMGVHSVPATNCARFTYFGSTSRAPTAYNLVQKIRYTPQFSDVTGGNIEVANLQCRLLSNTQYYMLRAEVTTAEQITLKIMLNDSVTLAGPITVPGIVHTIGQPIWFAFGAFDDGLYATAWQGDAIENEPTDWLISATDTTYGYGRYGVRTGVSAANTNVKPVIAKYDYYRVYVSEFNGEIADWPQEYTDDGVDKIVPVTAGGILRRYAENKAPLGTALRRYYERHALVKPEKYYPLEEGELATQAQASGGNAQDIAFFANNQFTDPDNATQKHFAQGKLGAWFKPGVLALNTDQFQVWSASAPVQASRIAVQWARQGGSQTRDQFNITGYFAPGVTISGIDGDIYGIEFNAFTNQILITPGLLAGTTTVNVSALHNNIFDGAAHHFHFRTNATGGGGADLFWELIIDGFVEASGTVIAHPMITTLNITYWNVIDSGGVTPIESKPIAYGHVAWFVGLNDPDSDEGNVYTAFKGYVGEAAESRVARLCQWLGIKNFNTTAIGAKLGPQYSDSLFDQLEEITRTDGGVVNELMSARALHFYTLENIRTRTVQLTLNVGLEHVMPGWKPVRDTQRLVNKVTATKRDGGTYTYAKTTGRLSILDPKSGGAGEKEDEVKANPLGDNQLSGIAQREVSEGTVDKPRYPIVGVNLMSPSIRSNLTLRRQVLDMFITARFKLTGMSKWHIFEDADLLVIGHKRYLSPYVHQVEFNTIPFATLDTFHVETAGSILGTNSSFLTNAVDGSATAWDVHTVGKALWTTAGGSMPILSKIEGEDVSVTAVTTTAPVFRSVGAASHGDNATLNPALNAGQAAGDILFCVTAIRNDTATANTPAGYLAHLTPGSLQVATKVSTGGGESAPSCTYSGGALGDTTSAFVFSIQNSVNNHTDGNALTNGSAQNIPFPTCPLSRANGILLLIAWKQDDYTSIAVPADWTEIIEASTVTGNDQSLYAAYRLVPFNFESTSRSDTLVVTGGAAAISKAVVFYFATPQRLTVSRSQNGVVKSHPANAAIRIAYPKVLG